MLSHTVTKSDNVDKKEENEDSFVVLEIFPESDAVFPNNQTNTSNRHAVGGDKIQETHTELKYLKVFDRNKIELLEKKFGKTAEELDNLIDTYHKSYWYYKSKNYASMLLNVFYLAFQIDASSEGVKSFIQVFDPEMNVPDSVAYGIGVPSSILDFLFYSLTFSPQQQAIKSTLEYSLQDPIHLQIKKLVSSLREKPFSAISDLTKFMFNESILLVHNLTGAMTEVIDNMKTFNKLPLAARGFLISFLLYFGNYYYKKFMKEDYYEGLDFWFNNKNHRWLIKELWHGNIATPLQVFFQGIISTVLLRSYPFYYYLGDASREALGFWVPPTLVAMMVAWQSLCVLYPATFNYYMSDQEKAEALLRQKIDWDLVNKVVKEQLAKMNLTNINPEDYKKWENQVVGEYIKLQKSIIETHILQTKGHAFLLKCEPHNIIQLLFRGIVGGYLSYQYLPLLFSALNAPTTISVLSGLFGAGFFMSLLYKAEQNRVMDKLVFEHIQENNKKENTQNDQDNHKTESASVTDEKKTCYSTLVNISSYFFSIGNGVSSAMATIGTGVRTFGGNTPIVLGTVALVAVENMLNGIYYSTEKVSNALKSLFPSSSSVSKVPSTLFYHTQQTPSVSETRENDNLLVMKATA